MKNTLLKWATLVVALIFGTIQVSSRDVTFTGVASGWATQSGVTFVNVGSASSKKIDCLSASNVSYLTLNGAGKYIQFTLTDASEKIDGITIIWLAAASNQVLPILFGDAISVPDPSTIISTVTNGGIVATPPIAASGGSNCPTGSDITFPASATAHSIMLGRTMSTDPALYSLGNVYPTMSARVSTASGSMTTETGTGSTPAIGQIILHISSITATITDFKLDNTYSGVIDQVNKTINVTLPYAYYNTHITSLTPSFVNTGSFVTANPTDPKDFTNPVTYTIQNTAGTQTTYTVTVTRGAADKTCNMLSFSIPTQVGSSQFIPAAGAAKDSIIVTMPFSTPSFSALVPTYSISPLATSAPASAVAQDFTNPFKYTVTAEDVAVTKEYFVRIKRAAASAACQIKTISGFAAVEAVDVNQITGLITITVKASADVSNITPVIVFSDLSTHSAIPTNYNTDQTITVTAENGTPKTYTIKVVKDGVEPVLTSSKPAKGATGYSLAGVMTLKYSEPVKLGLGALSISGTGVLGTPVVLDSILKVPFSGLTKLTNYTLTIPKGVFVDAYGNDCPADAISFTTANDVLHKDSTYASHMNGENFEVPAFISGEDGTVTYVPTADVKATTTTQYGAYVIPAGKKLVIKKDQVGSILASFYAKGGNRTYTITTSADPLKIATGGLINYDNNGDALSLNIESSVNPTEIYITNTSAAGDIYVPYLYVSVLGSTVLLDEKAMHCTSK